MMKLIRNIMILAALLTGAVSFAQPGFDEKISWKTSVKEKGEGIYQVLFTGRIAPGHYTYALDDKYSATAINDLAVKGGELVGEVYETGTPTTEADGSLHYYGTIELAQDVKAEEGATVRDMIIDSRGDIWAASSQGLAKYEKEKDEFSKNRLKEIDNILTNLKEQEKRYNFELKLFFLAEQYMNIKGVYKIIFGHYYNNQNQLLCSKGFL